MSVLEKGKIVVTGGAGFIGSAIVWALNRRNIENILVTDYLGEGDKFKNLVPLRFDDYVEADKFLKTVQENPKQLTDVVAIFHLGACSATTETNNRYLIENNYEYTKQIAQWCIDNNIRFVTASSASTYGDGSNGMVDSNADIQKLRPLNMYGYSKQLFDLYAKRRGILEKIVALKYFNVFGPNECHKGDMRSVVHKAYQQISNTDKVSLFKSYHNDYEDGKQMRDFLYVKDAVDITLSLAETPTANGIFNVGSGQANTWIDLVTPIFKALNKAEKIEFIEMPDYLRPKYQYYTCANIDKLRKNNYTKSITPLSDAVYDYVSNYLVPEKQLGDAIEK